MPNLQRNEGTMMVSGAGLSCKSEKLGVTIHLGTEATVESVLAEKPDTVVVATGAVPLVPPIPGLRNAITLSLHGTCCWAKPPPAIVYWC